jgi:DNA replication protein DnaC
MLESISRVATAASSGAEPEPAPECPRCRDVGFLRAEVPVSHPDFGTIVACACRVVQVRHQRTERLRNLSNLGPLARLTFELLAPDGRRQEPGNRQRFRMAFDQARRFAEQPEGWLVLLGPSGCGKTHLAAGIANQRIANGQPAVFSNVPDLLDHLRTAYSPQSEITYDELFETIRGTELLILDDLGTQSSTPWAQEKLFQLLNHRYHAQLPTVVTSNQRLEELDERLRSRLTDPQLAVVCLVEDWDPGLLAQLGGLSHERLRSMTFEAFDVRGIDYQPNETLRAALRLARGFSEEPNGWLVLTGLPGTGKTHLAAAIANVLQARGEPVCFVTVPDLLDHLRAAFAPDSRIRYDRAFDAVRTAPVLILDDLGSQSGTPWAQEKLFQLFNHRYNARLPTVITSNLVLDDHDARLRSRMLDPQLCTLYVLETTPYRLQPGKAASPKKPPLRRR